MKACQKFGCTIQLGWAWHGSYLEYVFRMQKNHIRVKTVAICSLDILLAVIICEAAVVGFSTVVSISNCASIMCTSVLLHSLYDLFSPLCSSCCAGRWCYSAGLL